MIEYTMTASHLHLEITNGITWYQSGHDPKTFLYFPCIRPKHSQDGTISTSLLKHSAGGMLMLGVVWNAELEDPQILLQAISRRYPTLKEEEIRLQQARIDIRTASLWIVDGDSDAVQLATNELVVHPPHAAVFNISLTLDQIEVVQAALEGNNGCLAVRYDAALKVDVTASVTVEAQNLTEVLQAMDETEPQDSDALLEQLIELGHASLTKTGGAPDESALWIEAETQSRSDASRFLADLTAPNDQSMPLDTSHGQATLYSSVTLNDAQELPFEVVTDIGGWFRGNPESIITFLDEPAPALIGELGGVVEKRAEGITILKSPDWSESLPVAFITITCGDVALEMKPPNFDPVTFDAPCDALHIVTQYKNKRKSYEISITPPGSEYALSLADLGLARVMVDARARQDAGSRKMKIDLRYDPEGDGASARETIYFRDDIPWQAEWIVISRAPNIAGTLEYRVRETSRDAGTIRYGPVHTSETLISIETHE